MSDPAPKKKRWGIGVSLGMLLIYSAGNILVLLDVVPKFEQIYKDALAGGGPLPALTEFIITTRFAIAIFVLGWPILGAVLVKLRKPYAILWINLGILWSFFQLGITIFALVKPMIGLSVGMSDSSP